MQGFDAKIELEFRYGQVGGSKDTFSVFEGSLEGRNSLELQLDETVAS